jgi:hypothetical protein
VQHLRVHTSSSIQANWDSGSEAEIVQIERLKQACRRIDRHWEVECGRSDEGDPWCAVYDWGQDRPILHIARIDGRYVVISPLLALSTATLRAAVDTALAELVTPPVELIRDETRF